MKKMIGIAITCFLVANSGYAAPSLRFEMNCKTTDGYDVNFIVGPVVNPSPGTAIDIEIVIGHNTIDESHKVPENIEVIKSENRFYIYESYFPGYTIVEFNRVDGTSFTGSLTLIKTVEHRAGVLRVSHFFNRMTCTSSNF